MKGSRTNWLITGILQVTLVLFLQQPIYNSTFFLTDILFQLGLLTFALFIMLISLAYIYNFMRLTNNKYIPSYVEIIIYISSILMIIFLVYNLLWLFKML